jgi:hypothetical protein
MAWYTERRWIAVMAVAALCAAVACSHRDEEQNNHNNDIWDIDKDGIPQFAGVNYIELDSLYRISKYRSSVGHDYSDAFEQCRSLKHYFEPKAATDWAAIKIFAPVTGTITRVEQEWAGTKIEIASDSLPAFRFVIFHVNTPVLPQVNDKVTAGAQLGTHIGSQTYSDIAVIVNDPTRQGRMVSYFEVMTDAVFQAYVLRGISSRQDLIIPRAVRDANPPTCSGDTFTSTDPLENWVTLN